MLEYSSILKKITLISIYQDFIFLINSFSGYSLDDEFPYLLINMPLLELRFELRNKATKMLNFYISLKCLWAYYVQSYFFSKGLWVGPSKWICRNNVEKLVTYTSYYETLVVKYNKLIGPMNRILKGPKQLTWQHFFFKGNCTINMI